jgi:hypothetical protein
MNETPTPTPKEEPVPAPSIDDPQTPDHVPELPPMRDPKESPPRSQRGTETDRRSRATRPSQRS